MKELSPEQWSRIDTLFERALQRPPGGRMRFIEEMSGDDTELRNELATLIEIHEEAGQILGDSVTGFADPLIPGMAEASFQTIDKPGSDADYADLLPGSVIGMYQVREMIGRGGMGQIYLAYRTDNLYDQPVAIKVMKARLNDDDTLRKFDAERKILASLDHPNIARLYDGGVSSKGLPYFVMEYVKGEPVDQYCNQQKCTLKERIQLFLTICNAVGFAHQNLVVHRDLKPSNILVKADGTVKLLDFGIATLLSEDESTNGGHFLSLAYASPEQLAGSKITTTSDVFSLGVILYKLLTGVYPLSDRRPGRKEFTDEDHPELPSEAILKPVNTLVSGLNISANEWSGKLAGDLDAIIMKALRTYPADRYSATEQLSDDIRRYENQLPVYARAATTGYRLQKFIGRHKAGFAASVAAILLLALFTGALIFQQAQTVSERNTAMLERDKATEIATFLEELLASADPSYGTERADTLRIRDLLQSGTERVRRELAGQPVIQAQMLIVLGDVYRNLGNYEEARLLLERSMQIRESLHEGDHPDVAESLNSFGALSSQTGEYDAASEYLNRALEMRLRLFGNVHKDVVKSYTTLANLKQTTGDYDEAEKLYREALSINNQLSGEPDKNTATSMANLATILQRKGNLDEAEQYHRQALSIYETVLSGDHPLIATSSNNLALLLTERGMFEQALPFARKALEMRKNLYGEQHPEVLTSLNNLASLLADIGNVEEAEELYFRSLELRRIQHGDESMAVAVAYNNLGTLFRKTGRYNDSVPLFRKAAETAGRVLGTDHPSVGIITGNLAGSLRLQGFIDEAEQHYTSALNLLQRTLTDDHPSTARLKIGLGECLTDRGSYQQAEQLIREGSDLLREKGSNLRVAHEAFVNLYRAWDRPDDAAMYQEFLTGTATIEN